MLWLKGNQKAAELLILNGANIEATDDKIGATALYYAAMMGEKEHVEFLVEKGANVNHKAIHNITPLHMAMKSKNVAIAECLLQNGDLVNAQEQLENMAPLHLAFSQGPKEMIDLLLSFGANVDIEDIHGFTPLDFAKKKNQVCMNIT